MTKISICRHKGKSPIEPINTGSNVDSLDTLEQLSPNHLETEKTSRNKFVKRQIAKAITLGQLFPLIDLDSPLKKSYWYTYHCNRLILQEGYKMTTKYCGHRWCTLCNRIKMAKMINAYSIPLLEFPKMYFVTLTAPNVEGNQLKEEINDMLKNWRGIYQYMKKNKMKVQGVRKLECTYNPHTGYNPHFHFIVNGEEAANMIVKQWLKRYPSASPNAQNIKPANEGGLIELFKYAVKGVHKGKFYPEALDTIYQAMRGRQTFRPIGIKKVVEENIDGIKSQKVTFAGYADNQWTWNNHLKDWHNQDGELLTDYIIEGKLSDWIDKLTEETAQDLDSYKEEQLINSTVKVEKEEFHENTLSYWSEYVEEYLKNDEYG